MWTDPFLPTRRQFLCRSAFGVGALALAHLLQQDRLLAETTGRKPEPSAEVRPLRNVRGSDPASG